jgi:hypothetical protein
MTALQIDLSAAFGALTKGFLPERLRWTNLSRYLAGAKGTEAAHEKHGTNNLV